MTNIKRPDLRDETGGSSRVGALCASAVLKLLGAAMALSLAATAPALAQSATPIEAVGQQVDQYDAALRAIARDANNPKLDDAALREKVAAIVPIDQALDAIVADLAERTAAIDARLAELGPAPAAGQPAEAAEIAQDRSRLVADRQAIDTEAKQARVLTVTTDQLTTQLSDRRRELFSTQLWSRSRSILDPRLWIDFGQNAPHDGARLFTLYKSQMRQIVRMAPSSAVLTGWMISLIVALLLVYPGGPMLLRLGDRYVAGIESATRLRKSLHALWIICVTTALPLISGWLIRVTLGAGSVLTPQMDSALGTLIQSAGFAALIYGIARALLEADNPGWRIAPISDQLVDRLKRYPVLTAGAVGLASAVAGLNSSFGMSLSTSIITDALTVLAELAIIGRVLTVVAKSRGSGAAAPNAAAPQVAAPWAFAALANWLGLLWAVGAAVLGYLALATFLVREMIWSATVLACLFILIGFTDDLFPMLVGTNSRSGRFVESILGFSRSTLNQIGILLAGFARLSLLLFGWTAIVAPFGASTSDIFSRFTSFDLVLHLGPVAISPGTIIGGMLLFGVSREQSLV